MTSLYQEPNCRSTRYEPVCLRKEHGRNHWCHGGSRLEYALWRLFREPLMMGKGIYMYNSNGNGSLPPADLTVLNSATLKKENRYAHFFAEGERTLETPLRYKTSPSYARLVSSARLPFPMHRDRIPFARLDRAHAFRTLLLLLQCLD